MITECRGSIFFLFFINKEEGAASDSIYIRSKWPHSADMLRAVFYFASLAFKFKLYHGLAFIKNQTI